MPSMHTIKLTRPGGETRRTSFPRQPSWPELETRIATLFGIPSDSVAVTYEDSDGDIVTLSSQEELVDYLVNTKRNEPIKFNVINTKEVRKSPPSGDGPTFPIGDGLQGGIPTVGPTMIYELDDQEWQRLPGMPNVFSMREPMMDTEDEPHAFVEVIDSEANSRKGSATPASDLGRSPQNKGKGRAMSTTTKSVSSASVVEDDIPSKPAVHVYGAHGASMLDPTSHESATGLSPHITPRQAPTLDLETPPPTHLPTQPTGGTTGNTFNYSETPSFVSDISHIVDDLTQAFASHPELSEGLRNIVKNTVQGVYWERGSQRVNEAIHDAAQRTSANIGQSARDLSSHSDEDVVRRIAEALGGVFKVIGDIAGAASQGHGHPHRGHHGRPHHHHFGRHHGPPGSPHSRPPPGSLHGSPRGPPGSHVPPPPAHDMPPPPGHHGPPPHEHHGPPPPGPPGPPPPVPPPPGHYGPPPPGHHGHPPPGPPPPHGHFEPPPTHGPHLHHGPPLHGSLFRDQPSRGLHGGFPFLRDRSPLYPYGGRSARSPPPDITALERGGGRRGYRTPSPPLHGDPFDRYRAQAPYYGGRHRTDPLQHGYGAPYPPALREQWESGHHQDGLLRTSYDQTAYHTAHESKAQLEAAKAVYKAEKEKFQREKEERRRLRRELSERRAEEGRPRIDGTREETIVARIPLAQPSRSRASRGPYAEIYSVPALAEPAVAAPAADYAANPAPQFARAASPQLTVYPAPIPPPIPPVPTVAPAAPNVQVASAPAAPLPWPAPPVAGSSRRALSSLRDRIIARLFEMGITSSSQPELMEILDGHSNRTNVNEEEVLADIISALNINSNPSPRPPSARLA